MAIGETILKVTDYPVSYSVAFLLMHAANISPLSADATVYFLAAGIGATFFTVVDPVGRGLKEYMKLVLRTHLRKFANKEPILKTWNDAKGALNTNAIEAEKDRIVNIAYFLGVMALLMSLIQDEEFFSKYFGEFLTEDPNCSIYCFQNQVFFSIFIVSIIVGGIGGLKGAYIIDRAKTVATYQKCVNSLFVLDSTKASLGDYIKLGDWETAKNWRDKIEREFVTEEGLKEKREQKLREHVGEIINQFSKFKKEKDHENQLRLSGAKDFPDFSYHFTLEEKFKKFPLYDRLLEHLYTNESNEIYSLFEKYLNLEKKIREGNSEWLKEENEGIKKIINQLELHITERLRQGIRADNEQWVNTDLIKHDLDRFLTFERDSLLSTRNKPNTALWQVRFFDSSTLPTPRDDVVAELNQAAAEKLSVELASLAKKLKESVNYMGTDFHDSYHTQKKLENKIDELFLSYEVKSEPLGGSCILCRNDQFFSKSIIIEHERKLEEFPKDLMSKDVLITKPSRQRPQKDAVKSN